MATIKVSIDAKGNLQCPDTTGSLGESFTWVPDGDSVSSIESIVTSVGSLNPAPSAKNSWTGTFATDGPVLGGVDGLVYTIVVNSKNVGFGQKQKTPKIVVSAPIPVKKK